MLEDNVVDNDITEYTSIENLANVKKNIITITNFKELSYIMYFFWILCILHMKELERSSSKEKKGLG